MQRCVSLFSPHAASSQLISSHPISSHSPSPQGVRDAGLDTEAFLTVGVSAALRQLLEFGLFHGDPHPGNIFAMRDGRIAYVDFGNVAELSQVRLSLKMRERP